MNRLWRNDAYLTSILLTVFSGVFPYLMVLLLLLPWFSLAALSRKSMGRTLGMMHDLGKLSFFAIWLVAAMAVVGHVDTTRPGAGGSLGVSLITAAVGDAGLYVYLAGAIVSLAFTLMSVRTLGAHAPSIAFSAGVGPVSPQAATDAASGRGLAWRGDRLQGKCSSRART